MCAFYSDSHKLVVSCLPRGHSSFHRANQLPFYCYFKQYVLVCQETVKLSQSWVYDDASEGNFIYFTFLLLTTSGGRGVSDENCKNPKMIVQWAIIFIICFEAFPNCSSKLGCFPQELQTKFPKHNSFHINKSANLNPASNYDSD